jgi:hypothetical protein
MSTVENMQKWIRNQFPKSVVRTVHNDDYDAVILGSVALVIVGDMYGIGRVGGSVTPSFRLDMTHAATWEFMRVALADTSVSVEGRLRRLVDADVTEDADGYHVSVLGEHVADIRHSEDGSFATTIGGDVEEHGYLSSALLTVAEHVASV